MFRSRRGDEGIPAQVKDVHFDAPGKSAGRPLSHNMGDIKTSLGQHPAVHDADISHSDNEALYTMLLTKLLSIRIPVNSYRYCFCTICSCSRIGMLFGHLGSHSPHPVQPSARLPASIFSY